MQELDSEVLGAEGCLERDQVQPERQETSSGTKYRWDQVGGPPLHCGRRIELG